MVLRILMNGVKKLLLLIALAGSMRGLAQLAVLHHSYYTCYFDTARKVPVYSSYLLTRDHLKRHVPRTGRFYKDPLVNPNQQAGNATYAHNGIYDKGHLSPDADFRFDSIAERETMYYTNVAPQVSGFNRKLWKAVETYVRHACETYDSVWVWTGCLYDSATLNEIAVPAYYWKVIRFNHHIEAWLGKNEEHLLNTETSIRTDVRDIEQRTGLVFEVCAETSTFR